MVQIAPGVKEPYFSPQVNACVPSMLRQLVAIWGLLIFCGILAISNFTPSREQLEQISREQEI